MRTIQCDLLDMFVIDSRDLLARMKEALLGLEQNPDDPELVEIAFRVAHNINGSAGMCGATGMMALARAAEKVLDRCRSGRLRIDVDVVALFLAVCDELGEQVTRMAEDRARDRAIIGESGDALLRRLTIHLGDECASARIPHPTAHREAGRTDTRRSFQNKERKS